MGDPIRDNRLTVDLEAIAANLAALRNCLPPGTRVAGVVKADAYGHGLVPVARLLKSRGCEALAVAHLHEALSLRRAGVEGTIYLLLGIWPEQAALAVEHRLTPVTEHLEVCQALAAAGRASGRPATCQLKVDTGMGRLGLPPAQALEVLRRAAALEGLVVTGLVSHLATAGEPGCPHVAAQTRAFAELLARARQEGFPLPDSSLVGTGGTLVPPPDLPGPPGLARLGVGLYGGLPSPGAAGRTRLTTAMRFTSRLLKVHRVPAGTRVSYGGTWVAPADTWLGVVAAGYGDGYLRSLSNRGWMLVGGRRIPIRGRVCMNLTVVELAEPLPARGDEVVLLGRQGQDQITVDELADWAGTIPYEITCALGAANPVEYLGT